MAFEFPIMEMNFALGEFEFKVFTLEIDFQFRILTSGNRFFNLIFLLFMATLGHRNASSVEKLREEKEGTSLVN